MPVEKDIVTDAFRQAAENFTRTVQAGVKFQEQTASFWNEMMEKGAGEFRTQWEKLSHDFAPYQKKTVEQIHRLVDEQSRRSLELLRKSFDAGKGEGMGDVCEKMTDLWKSSFDRVRESADMLAQANAELFDGWTDMLKSVGTPRNGHSKPAAKPARR